MTGKWTVIAISGVTCGGKGCLTEYLKPKYKSAIVFHQDDYFLPPDDSRHTFIKELNHINWDILSSLDLNGLYNDVATKLKEDSKESSGLIILEGFLVLNYKPLADLCKIKYFFTLTKEQCWQRRRNRTYDPADVPGYFDQCVWPMYLKYKDELANDSSITFIDGSMPLETTFTRVVRELDQLLSS